ncbi:MAG: hypothetical protein ACOC1P_03095 [Minisyncoccales bacterium]
MFKSPFKTIRELQDQNNKLLVDNRVLEDKLSRTQSENLFLSTRLKERNNNLPVIDTDLKDPSPNDKQARKAYTHSVRQFFEDIFEDKLKHMISNTQTMLSQTDNNETLDKILKGTIYSFREMLFWGERMSAEARSYDLDEKSSQVDKEQNIIN